MPLMIDHAAKEIALRGWGLPECLHVPVAAVDENAIRTYVGEVLRVLSAESDPKAFLVKVRRPDEIDRRLPIWQLEASSILHQAHQVWVHIGYSRYRSAYKKAFPDEDITNKIMSHALNRRIATLKGLQFVRITPISRSCNSSSAFSENWGVALWSKPDELQSYRRRGAFIHYADLTDLMVMMDIRVGGGVMDVVNEGQKLVRPSQS